MKKQAAFNNGKKHIFLVREGELVKVIVNSPPVGGNGFDQILYLEMPATILRELLEE